MIELSGQKITQVVGNGQLVIHTDAGWIISIESALTYTAADGTSQDLAGDAPVAAEVLAPVLTGHTIQSTQLNETDGLTMMVTPDIRLAAPPDDDFEAWNVVGPQGQRTVSMPGGELATWNPDPSI